MTKSAPATDAVGLHYMNSAVGETIKITERMAENPTEAVAGDPAKLGETLIELVKGKGRMEKLQDVHRVPLGSDATHLIENKIKHLVQEFEIAKSIAKETDFEGHSLSAAASL